MCVMCVDKKMAIVAMSCTALLSQQNFISFLLHSLHQHKKRWKQFATIIIQSKELVKAKAEHLLMEA